MPTKLEHAALGRAQGREPGLGGCQEREVLGQLAMQESGGIGAFGADHAQVREGGYTMENGRSHG